MAFVREAISDTTGTSPDRPARLSVKARRDELGYAVCEVDQVVYKLSVDAGRELIEVQVEVTNVGPELERVVKAQVLGIHMIEVG